MIIQQKNFFLTKITHNWNDKKHPHTQKPQIYQVNLKAKAVKCPAEFEKLAPTPQ